MKALGTEDARLIAIYRDKGFSNGMDLRNHRGVEREGKHRAEE